MSLKHITAVIFLAYKLHNYIINTDVMGMFETIPCYDDNRISDSPIVWLQENLHLERITHAANIMNVRTQIYAIMLVSVSSNLEWTGFEPGSVSSPASISSCNKIGRNTPLIFQRR